MGGPVPVFAAEVKRGKVTFHDKGMLRAYIDSLEGEQVDVTIRKHRAGRSHKASRYYFGVVVKMLSEFTGYEPGEMHELLAYKFLRIEDDPFTGAPRRMRTPKMDTAHFATYVDQCIRFAAELGVVIPDANSVEAA